jgi:hypothetical protein
MSATCDAAAAGVLCMVVSRWTGSRIAGVVSGALFASAPGVWAYAISAEVFALNNLFATVLLLLSVLYAEKRDVRLVMAGAFVMGLGACNHHTIVFTALPLGVWALWVGGAVGRAVGRAVGPADLLQPRVLAKLAACFLAGLLPYLYLPIAGAGHSPVSWGATNTWHGFWTHVLRREYGTFQLAPNGIAGESHSRETFAAWVRDVVDEAGWWGIGLAAVGVWASVRAARETQLARAVLVVPILAVGTMVVLGNLPVGDLLHRGIVARFWQQPDVIVFAWCGWGVAWLAPKVPRAVALTAAGAVAVLPGAFRFPSMDRHTNTLVRSYGAEILRAAPPGALLVTKGDLITSSMRYLQAEEGQRPDVRIVDQELLGFAWYGPRVLAEHPEIVLPQGLYAPGTLGGFTMKQLLDANYARASIQVCGGVKPGDMTADATYGRWPWGLCEAVHLGSEPVNVEAWIRDSEAALPRIDFAGQAHPPGSWEDIVWSDYWEVRASRAAHLIAVAGADPSRRPYIAAAADMLQQLVDDDPEPRPHMVKNLAIALGRAGLETPEQKARAAEAWRRYLAVARPDDPQLPAIRKELERLTR